jgi:hypothetical protein
VDNRIEVYVYVPCKGYMIGMPMRDISAVEWESLPQELREAALKQGLYILHKTKKEVKDA